MASQPDPAAAATGVSNAAIVERFYSAVAAQDSAVLADVVDQHFVEDASIEWPSSLPYGGRVEGASVLRKIFTGMASSPQPVGPAGLRVRGVTADAQSVVAELVFTYHSPAGGAPVESGALERWTFDAGRVRTIRAYYWDTAALVAGPTAP